MIYSTTIKKYLNYRDFIKQLQKYIVLIMEILTTKKYLNCKNILMVKIFQLKNNFSCAKQLKHCFANIYFRAKFDSPKYRIISSRRNNFAAINIPPSRQRSLISVGVFTIISVRHFCWQINSETVTKTR